MPGNNGLNTASFFTPVQKGLQEVETLLRSQTNGAHPDLGTALEHLLASGGKRIRPALCLVTCEALGGNSDKALYFAAAVELLHNMLLIHDDIEDGDTMRRNQPTVWKAYGPANAINVGDYLFARALRAVNNWVHSPLTMTASVSA